jgi:hypothetical protein
MIKNVQFYTRTTALENAPHTTRARRANALSSSARHNARTVLCLMRLSRTASRSRSRVDVYARLRSPASGSSRERRRPLRRLHHGRAAAPPAARLLARLRRRCARSPRTWARPPRRRGATPAPRRRGPGAPPRRPPPPRRTPGSRGSWGRWCSARATRSMQSSWNACWHSGRHSSVSPRSKASMHTEHDSSSALHFPRSHSSLPKVTRGMASTTARGHPRGALPPARAAGHGQVPPSPRPGRRTGRRRAAAPPHGAREEFAAHRERHAHEHAPMIGHEHHRHEPRAGHRVLVRSKLELDGDDVLALALGVVVHVVQGDEVRPGGEVARADLEPRCGARGAPTCSARSGRPAGWGSRRG